MAVWWLLLQKQEMTQIYLDNKLTSVTLMKFVPQELVRYKSDEKDGYVAAILWLNKKTIERKEKKITTYSKMKEFKVDQSFIDAHKEWDLLTIDILKDIDSVNVTSISKWKWFQWVMKRHNFKGGPATHGSKFHRLPGSIGNRKPRRVNKNHPLPGHMGTDKITLKNIKVLDVYDDMWIVVLKWSIPGSRNQLVNVYLR